MGFDDVQETMQAMRLAHGRYHLAPNEVASRIAANIMHDIPSKPYIDKTIEELESFIHALRTITYKIK